MIRPGVRPDSNGESGIAIFVTVAILVLLSAISMSVVMTTSTDAQIANAFRHGLEAAAAAEAGAHRALIDLAASPDWTPILDGSVRSAFADGLPAGVRQPGAGVVVDLDLVASLAGCWHAPPCTDAELDAITRARPWGPDNPRWRLYAYGPLDLMLPPGAPSSTCYVVVLVADDPGETDGNPGRDGDDLADGKDALLLRAEAFGPGGAHRAVEAVVMRTQPPGSALRVAGWRRSD